MVYKDPNQLSRAGSLERYYLGEELEEEPAGVCESKLVVELKSPESVDGGETTSACSVKEGQQQHYCYSCKRGFNSGKALGGHMSSAHVQAGRDYKSHRRLKSGSSDDEDEDEDEDGAGGLKAIKNVCGICKKVFPALKSLYGHMRCHPDRSYRGMNPPPADASEIPKSGKLSAFSSSDADNRLSSSLPARTADEESSDPVNSLVSLRNTAEIKVEICSCDPNPMPSDGDRTPPPRDHVKSIMEIYERNPSNINIPAADSDNFKDVKISTVGDSERKLVESPQAQGKAPLIMEPNNNQNNSPCNSSEENSEKTSPPPPELENQDQTYFEPRNSGSRKRSRIQKEGKGKELSGAEKEKKKYKCSSCNRVFAIHQALGGHMSSHNKISSSGSTSTKFTLQNNNNAVSDNNLSSCSPENQSISQPTDNSSPSHPCLICSKIFSSGQTLGGHMRCHASQLESSSSSSSSSSPQENSSSRQQKVLDFDLNELPNDDDDDDDRTAQYKV